MSAMTYLVTGGCGFIGTSLIAHIMEHDKQARIRVLDNLVVGTKEDLKRVCQFKEFTAQDMPLSNARVSLAVGDIRDYETCLQCSDGADIIVHLAANTGVAPSVDDPRTDMVSNVIGTFNLLEAARMNSIDKFIFASSGAPVGEVEPPIHEDRPARPVSPYGASKLAGEGYCSAYYRTFGVKTVSLRFGNVYGPRSRRKSSVVAQFMKLAFQDEVLEIFGDGNQTRDFIYIDDLVSAITLAIAPRPQADAAQMPWGETFQIATHAETTVNEIAAEISEIVQGALGKKVMVVHRDKRRGDVRRNYSDISKAIRILGWEPRVNIKEGLRRTFDYFVQERTKTRSISSDRSVSSRCRD